MPRRIEQVKDDTILGKCHNAGRYRNSALLFNLHPIRPRPPCLSARLYLARQMDRAALKQQLFGQRGFTRIRV